MHSLMLPILIRWEQIVYIAVKSKGVLSVSIDIPSPYKIIAYKWLSKFLTEKESGSRMWKPIFPSLVYSLYRSNKDVDIVVANNKMPCYGTNWLISFYLWDYEFDSISLLTVRAKSFAEWLLWSITLKYIICILSFLQLFEGDLDDSSISDKDTAF